MTALQEGYSNRYQKLKSNRQSSVSPGHYSHLTSQSVQSMGKNKNEEESQLGKIVSQINERVDGIQIKIVNMTNIMKLFQKYTQSKDQQYQKQKQNQEFRKTMGHKVGNAESLELQNKIKQIQSIIHKAKVQVTAMEGLRLSIQRENSHKTFSSPEPFETLPRTFQSPSTMSKQLTSQIQQLIDRVQINLRQEMNKKIDICMSFFKSASQNNPKNSHNMQNVSYSMMQEQIHNLTLTVSKVESEQQKNKMAIDNKISQVIDYVNEVKRKMISSERSINKSDNKTRNSKQKQDDDAKSQKSFISEKSKSKSKSRTKRTPNDSKHEQNSKVVFLTRIEQTKRQKEIQLRQAIRKKKENQQKLKMKK